MHIMRRAHKYVNAENAVGAYFFCGGTEAGTKKPARRAGVVARMAGLLSGFQQGVDNGERAILDFLRRRAKPIICELRGVGLHRIGE
jgi:hypothetical protein